MPYQAVRAKQENEKLRVQCSHDQQRYTEIESARIAKILHALKRSGITASASNGVVTIELSHTRSLQFEARATLYIERIKRIPWEPAESSPFPPQSSG